MLSTARKDASGSASTERPAARTGNLANRLSKRAGPEPVRVVVEEETVHRGPHGVRHGERNLGLLRLAVHPGLEFGLARERVAVDLVSAADEDMERQLLVGAQDVAPERARTVKGTAAVLAV